MHKLLSSLIDVLNPLETHNTGSVVIRGIAYDSRDVKEGYAFFALPGTHTDGKRFIGAAVDAGASLIVYQGGLDNIPEGIAWIKVADARRAMSAFSAAFYDRPSEKLRIIGVTGTDGKSSTSYYIWQLLRSLGYKCGIITTVLYSTGGDAVPNPLRQSSPEAPFVHAALYDMLLEGCEIAVVESTSHGLSPRTARLADVAFDAGVFTNITHEHLEFHGSFENYLSDKAELFRRLPDYGAAIINLDDKQSAYLAEQTKARRLYYSASGNNKADLWAKDIHGSLEGTELELLTNSLSKKIRLPLIGEFNADNVMAAVLACKEITGKSIDTIIEKSMELKSLDGRMQAIRCGQPFGVIVDYAHTPGAFERLFPFVKRFTHGRIITVFGSAGERDTEKRPWQGSIADRYADIIILTDEDPRLEDRMGILRDIAEGCTKKSEGKDLFLIPDRKKAIEHAFGIAKKGDLVLLLGKGHEKSIVMADGTIPWHEAKVAEEILASMGYKI
ncbi:UDP-N-acetylmuramoyl-L-alanyl-D-glutamate--2,6-diaminopimelate ligase [Spirochaetia bacterium 38H-sp]|uniref:UDP-N-acetylmuramyl-tripeptide synthetase n=1 Tax=Rarispira pelagica TaxID=3141764 RepID=A0ABU9UCQ3_9SPIR